MTRSFVRHRLGNGLRIVVAPDDRTPVVGISLWYLVGSKHELAGKSGFAHLFEHMMFEGSANVRKSEHFEFIEAAGGRTNAYTGLDATVYSDTLPSHQLELAIWLEADRMQTLGPALSEETLGNQREVVKNERRKRVDNQPYGTWEERIFALAYPASHPYHHSSWGSMEELSAASLGEIQDFFASYYLPNNAVMTIVGDIDPSAALELVDRHFGSINAGRVPQAPAATADAAVDGERLDVVRGPIPLPRLYLGCRIPSFADDRFQVADFISDLLTTGRASRLHERLVRNLRVAQSVLAWTFPLIDGSLLLIECTARPGVEPADLEAAVNAELGRLAHGGPTDEELVRVRRQRATFRGRSMEKAEERADRIGMYAALLDDPDRMATEIERDRQVDAAAVRAGAAEWLSDDAPVRLWFLPSD